MRVGLELEDSSSRHLPAACSLLFTGCRSGLRKVAVRAATGSARLSLPEGLLIYTIFALLKKGHCQAAFK